MVPKSGDQESRRSRDLPKAVRWCAGLPVALVAANGLFGGLALSVGEAVGWITWGHEALLVAALPVIVWAIANWMIERE